MGDKTVPPSWLPGPRKFCFVFYADSLNEAEENELRATFNYRRLILIESEICSGEQAVKFGKLSLFPAK